MRVPDRFPFIMPSNMFPSLCDVLGLVVGGGGRLPLAAFDNFTPPSNDLLAPSGLSKTLKVDSATGRAWTSSNAFPDDFRREKPLGNLGM